MTNDVIDPICFLGHLPSMPPASTDRLSAMDDIRPLDHASALCILQCWQDALRSADITDAGNTMIQQRV